MGFNNNYTPSRGHYSGTISASAFVGDGSGLTGISGSGTPGGAVNQVQTNNGAGAFNGSANFVFDGSSVGITGTLNVSGTMVASLKGERHVSGSVTIPVTVVSKSSDHRYNGQGSPLGYHLNGFESPYLDVYVGKTYKFTQDDASNNGHPFRFYLDAAKTTAYTTNVTTDGSGGYAGDYAQILITEDTPPVIYYQCSAHGYMGNVLYVHGAKNASGSFSGSFVGDGSGLTGVGGSPGGSTTQVQYNNGGSFAGSSNLTFNGTTLTASITGSSLEYTAGTVNTLTASGHVSASVFYGDGSNLTGISGSGGGSPGGSNTQVQFNDGGNFGGSSNLTFDGTSLTAQRITASVHVSASVFYGDGSNLTGISGSGGGGSAVDSDQTILAVQVFG